MQQLRLAELIGALSHALDMTEGQPVGHCLRCAYIGMQIAREIDLDPQDQWELYYTLLLKDLGCSSNAARICELYLTDDLSFKRDFKRVGDSLPQIAQFVLGHAGLRVGAAERFRAMLRIARRGEQIAQELVQTRCQRGADIARQLRFPEKVARAIHSLDEHWNGTGKPDKLAAQQIPLYARIALLAQVIDVFHTASGASAALAEVRDRRASWFDPHLVDAFERVAQSNEFWAGLASPTLAAQVMALEPAQHAVALDEDYLDEIAAAFGQVVDAKSPFTAGHSARVGLYADLISEQCELPAARRRWLRRGALLHDVGKLGVSNAILDKPGRLDDEEMAAIRRHAQYTEEILARIDAFAELARVAGAHHERLDGLGYPRGLRGDAIPFETRIITTADIFDALSAERPYRPAVPVDQTLALMRGLVGSALDARCYEALCRVVEQLRLDEHGAANSLLPPKTSLAA